MDEVDVKYKYTLHNSEMVNEYNKNCKESIKCYSNAIRRVNKITDMIKQIMDVMYNPNEEQKKLLVKNLIELHFSKEIEFIFSNRRKIRKQEYFKWEGKLFEYFQYVDAKSFKNFKNLVAKLLISIACEGSYTENEIKELIAKIISKALRHDFIKL